MILVYSHKITNRIRYIFNLMLCELIGAEVELTSDEEVFKNYTGPKISYTGQPVSDELFFLSKPLLFENDISDYTISITEFEGVKVFFQTSRNSALPFDPFSAAFFLVSRYEEYLPHIKDVHENFDAKESLAYQKGFLERPVINIWAQMVKRQIINKYPEMHLKERRYKFISTIDIDNAFAYKEKGLVRTIGAFARSISQFNLEEIGERLKVLLGRRKDPFDTYEYQLEVQKKYNLKVIYFILLAEYGINDKNVSLQSRRFQSLIKSLADYAEVGLHPGFNSNKNIKKLKEEHARLEDILKREVTKSRQHFLRLTLPETYRNLIDLDITDDFTMGFASRIGFRAGICSSFNFYDLDLDIETKLRVHPFAVMDSSLKYYMKLSPDNAMAYVAPLINDIKAVNGTFISVWHNESLSGEKQWEGWKGVYEKMVEYANNY
jgi:hypothetical protein